MTGLRNCILLHYDKLFRNTKYIKTKCEKQRTLLDTYRFAGIITVCGAGKTYFFGVKRESVGETFGWRFVLTRYLSLARNRVFNGFGNRVYDENIIVFRPFDVVSV